MNIDRSRTMTTGLLGPLVGELSEFLEGLPVNHRVSVQVDKGDIHDPGYITLTADESAIVTKPIPAQEYFGPYGSGVSF